MDRGKGRIIEEVFFNGYVVACDGIISSKSGWFDMTEIYFPVEHCEVLIIVISNPNKTTY